VIAGIWLPEGHSDAESVLARLSRAVEMAPCLTAQRQQCALAVWPLAPSGRIDNDQCVAWTGIPRKTFSRVGLANAGRLGGQYAVIAGASKGLVLGCGFPTGRCLYFVRLPCGAVAACSRLEPLAACLDGASPNRDALAALLLARSPADASATVFHEIRRVKAGEAVLVDSRGIVEKDDAVIEVLPHFGAPDDLASELRAVLQRAVERSIGSARRVAVLVSGGLDSSSVLAHAVAVARGATRREIDAITWSFGGPGDDRPYLRELCEDLGILPVRIFSGQAAPRILDAMIADGAPLIWPTAAPRLTAFETARDRGAEVILTGTGGDQVFGGDPRVLAPRVASRDWFRTVFRRDEGERGAPFLRIARSIRHLVAPAVASKFPMIQRHRRRRYAHQRWPWAGPYLRRVMTEMVVRAQPNRDFSTVTSEAKLKRLAANDFALLASNCTQMEALAGVTQADPLLDDEVVALTSSFPQHMLLFEGRQRGLFRHAMRQLLPERLRLRRDKAVFEPAIAELVQGGNLNELRDLASMKMLGDMGLVCPQTYRRHFEALIAAGGESRNWLPLWPALAVEAFVRSQWGDLGRKHRGR